MICIRIIIFISFFDNAFQDSMNLIQVFSSRNGRIGFSNQNTTYIKMILFMA